VKLPRFFGKKRGHRRTGSQAWASLGEGLFHATLLGAGVVFGGLLASGVAVPEWRINHDFPATSCTVVAKGLERRAPVGAAAGGGAVTWQPYLKVRYEVKGGRHESWTRPISVVPTSDRADALARLSSWRLGETMPGWYDPRDASRVVLERGYNWWMWLLALLLPGALVAFGGAGVARSVRRWGKSEERRAAPSRLSGLLDPLAGNPAQAPDHPGVPACEDHVNSPGTLLRYRLPIESPESWTLLGFGLFAVLWNAILILLMVGAGFDLLGGRTDWLLIGLLVPFACVGIAGIVVFLRGLVLATAMGTTQVEISAHPLRPGGTYDVHLAQGGSGLFTSLDVTLELEEQATFRQGTDTRTEKIVVWRQPVQSWRGLQLAPGQRFEGRTVVSLPPTVMHSFASEHNYVRWSIVVRGVPARWPAFTRVFPVVVFPGQDGLGTQPGGRRPEELP
jgi:hypothetical protein